MSLFKTILLVSFLTVFSFPALAQEIDGFDDDPDNGGPVASAAHTGEGVVFLELYSSESCPFCPAAERNLKDLTNDPTIIGVTCMVDYFDSGKPSILSRPFCQTRQDVFVHMLKAGSNYTPQLVINGVAQMPGQDLQKVSRGIQKARDKTVLPQDIVINLGHEPGAYDALLPGMAEGSGKYVLRITLVKHVPSSDLFSGAVQQRERSPHNVATSMIEGGTWNGKRTIWSIKPQADGIADAFIVTVQDQTSGAVMAAGQMELAVAADK